MPSFLDDRVDSDAILEDIRNIVEIESLRATLRGVDGDGAHTNDEYMLFSSIEPRTRLLQGLMERLE